MIDIDIDTLRNLYQMEALFRYNTRQRIKSESVATHSYFVALFSMMICDELDVPKMVKSKAIQIALVHDTPEIFTNDITYDAKLAMPAVNALLEPYEESFIKSIFPAQHAFMYDGHMMDDKIAKQIVKLADILSVVQYLDNEARLGNRTLDKQLAATVQRYNNEKLSLERMGISCPKTTT